MRVVLLIFLSVCLGVIALIAGCARTPVSTFYILNPIPRPAQEKTPVPEGKNITISLGPVAIPEFLDRPQIVTRSSPNKLELAEFHRWGGSFQNEVLRVLGENLSILLNSDHIFLYLKNTSLPIDYRITLDVKQFDGKLGGDVVLHVEWVVTNQHKKGTVIVKKSLIRESTQSGNYEALVSAQSRALAKLSHEIVDVIKPIHVN